MYKLTLPATIAILACLATPLSFAAGNSTQEISTAKAHAQYAEKSTNKTMADMHLHHVINCIVGPNGNGFDANAGNPCKGMGNGALNDVQNRATKQKLDHVLMIARRGLHASKLTTTQHDAKWAVRILSSAGSDSGISG